jgi:hypothetical protein
VRKARAALKFTQLPHVVSVFEIVLYLLKANAFYLERCALVVSANVIVAVSIKKLSA